jgi:D-lactate dehydrogenase
MPDAAFTAQLKKIAGANNVLTDPGDCLPYGYDNSRMQATPDAVVFPVEEAQIQELVRLCNQHGISLIARGKGTGTTGATVPTQGGLVLSLERMNRILEVDPDNRLIRVQPGVTNQEVQDAAAQHGFFWPPDPTSAAICTVGGNLAYNSAGPKAVKYGTPRENTLGLRAVTGTGEVIQTGVRTTKGVVGLDLTRLIIGSEGILGVITEATLKLTPLSESKITMRAFYSDMHAAARAVSAIMSQAVVPCALEFLDGAALDMIRDRPELDIPDNAHGLLMIEVDGPAACLEESTKAVASVASSEGCLDLEIANSQEEVQRLWQMRKALSPTLRKVAPKKINEDVVVPVSHIPELISGLDKLSVKHETKIVNFGHAGNGNIHVNLLTNPDDPVQMRRAEACLDEVFDLVLSLGGSLSGEHGIGLAKRDYISREIGPEALALMHQIKQVFDPNNILNPGKQLPPPAPST